MFYMKTNQTNKQMAPAFSSLSFKAKRNMNTRIFKEFDISQKVSAHLPFTSDIKKINPDPYFKSLMEPDTSCINKKLKQNQQLSHVEKNIHQGGQELEKKEFKSKVYGAIMRYTDKNTKEVYYALIQGRYTGKWSFPKGHSNKGEEPYDCVKREVFEETGIKGLPNPTSDQRIGFGHYYIFDVETKYDLQPQDKKEVMNHRWVTQKELDELQLNVDASYFKKSLLIESTLN
jgi:8-oxo-dGTP pyrophosphatase MutT (NUDIX family)